MDKEKLVKFWKSSASRSGSRNFSMDSLTLRDRTFFDDLAHISGKPDRIFTKILSYMSSDPDRIRHGERMRSLSVLLFKYFRDFASRHKAANFGHIRQMPKSWICPRDQTSY